MNQNYYNKYIKYKNKYLESQKQKGGLVPPTDYPIQDVYENSIEPVWKNIIANELNDFVDKYYEQMTPDDIKKTNNFIEQFNALYESDVVLQKLEDFANGITNVEIKPLAIHIFASCERKISELFVNLGVLRQSEGPTDPCFNCVEKTPYTEYDIGRIANKRVFILDKVVGEFSSGTDYFDSVGKLISPYSNLVSSEEKIEQYYTGFKLTELELNIVARNVTEIINVNNSMLQTLLELDRINEYGQDLTRYEILRSDNKTKINDKMNEVIKQTYFYIGKLFGIIANQLYFKANNGFYTGEINKSDPIGTFLLYAGIIRPDNPLNERIARGFQQMALSHIAHGMSSAELVARIASSVRTSYPQSLITALCVRSGAYHGGAMQRAIPMIKKYFDDAKNFILTNKITGESIESIQSNPELDSFVGKIVSSLLSTGKIFAFGHRIHKSPEPGKPCADPRALEYLEIVHQIYQDSKPLELLLIDKFLHHVRTQKPSLGCNSDFAIAVFCVLTSVPESDAEGMFVMCRIPGFCARIVRELLGKPNARRLPFAPILPYVPPKE